MKNYRHYISICITLAFVCLTIFVFPTAFIRIKESCVDLFNSLHYYFNQLFGDGSFTGATINNLSSVDYSNILGLPKTWAEFKVMWVNYWQVFANGSTLTSYFNFLGELLNNISHFLLLVFVPLIFIFMLCFKKYTSTINNDYNKDSNYLILYKKFENKIFNPVILWLKDYISFLKTNKYYLQIWIVVWLFNFNFFAICVSLLAYYLYFVASFDFVSIFIQIYKLFCDLSLLFAFIPWYVWLVIIICLIYKLAKFIGYKRLNHFEHKNCGFINERPIVTMVCGTMGKKKTTTITDMALSEEVILRTTAYNKILECDMKFPNFPWVNLEIVIKKAMDNHTVYNLATIRDFIAQLQYYFDLSLSLDKSSQKALRRYFNKLYGFKFNNLCFDYDYNRYGLLFDDGLKVVDLWQVLTDYAQLYFVYVMSSCLILSNYSIRTDNLKSDLGNFPIWDSNFFMRDSKQIDYISKHSHILDFDALRLGNKLLKNNELKDSFDFGVINITEIGKERKNNLELKDVKKSDELTNQKNDGFNDWLKMVRHSATIDNFPFVKVITDEQRPDSWGADARDLCEIVHIKEANEIKLALPFFAPCELMYAFVISRFFNLYSKIRHNRSDNTLFLYLYKKLASRVYNFYKKTYNTFGFCVLDIQVESGTQDGILQDKKYYLMNKKIYSKRFSTDCFSDFFTEKSKRSNFGLNDLPEYDTEKATIDELLKQNSYFITDLVNKNKGDK